MPFAKLRCQWRFVSIAENAPELPGPSSIQEFYPLPSTFFPHLSQAFSTGHYEQSRADVERITTGSHRHCRKKKGNPGRRAAWVP